MDKVKDYQLLIVGLFFSVSLVICASIGANTLSRSGINVTGSAQEIITSDRAVWRIEVKTAAYDKAGAYSKLKDQVDKVEEYLLAQQIKKEEIELKNTNSYITYKKDPKTGYNTNQVDFYNFSQSIQVSSNEINKIKDLSLQAESLLTKGINLRSLAPRYYYTKLAELKPRLLDKAVKDAKTRAQAMLKNTGNSIGPIRSAKSGVFQITPPDSTDVSDYGIYNTSTIKKKVTAVVQTNFKIR